ncbi:arginine--tRNA ligase [Patescibacteria group bacterium]|nr:arginine--tRNA ligase [Patescibacteria group bacterium]MBU1868142.1 arginine--tRNA ligase [Patescibacteria group bacterium]
MEVKMKTFEKQKHKPVSPFAGLIDKSSIKCQLQFSLAEALRQVFQVELEPEKITLEHPSDENFGDYYSNICMVQAKKIGEEPGQIAEKLKNKILRDKNLKEFISLVEVAEGGFLNFRLTKNWLLDQLREIVEQGDRYGSTELGKGRKEMVEFNQANTNKHFHVGHLRNTCLGESVCRILEFNGFKIWRTSFQGDIGLHIAKTIWAVRRFGVEDKVTGLQGEEFMNFISEIYVKGANAYKKIPEAKEEIACLNKEIYKAKELGEGKIFEIWQLSKEKALAYFEEIYQRLGTFFDKLYFDSDVVAGKEDVLAGLDRGVFEKSEGAIIFPGEKYGLHTRVFINNRDVPTYDAKDIRLARMKTEDFDFGHCIFIIGEEQKEYLRVIFKALELLGIVELGSYYHRYYGFVNLGYKGKIVKMSSRFGNVVTTVDLINEAKLKIREYLEGSGKEYMEDEINQVVEKVAVGALKYSMLKIEPGKSIAFDLDKSISFEGDSGPYLQYTYARAKSILRKVDLEEGVLANFNSLVGYFEEREMAAVPCDIRQGFAITNEEEALLRLFYRFPEVVNEAARNLEPHRLTPYLFNLAQKFNTFYQKVPVLKAETEELRYLRLLMTMTTAQVIKNGLGLLGIDVLEEM